MTVKRPVLRYFGGKWVLAPWIISHFPAHRIYVEPYGGAASVLLRKERCYAEVYNDLDKEIVNLFRVLRDKRQGKELKRLLQLTPFAREEFELSYIKSDDPVEQARRTVIRSFMGFGTNGLWRNTGFRPTSLPGNVVAHEWINYSNALDGLIERMQGVIIENRPAIDIMRYHDTPKTLHYVDPPYVQSTRQANTYRHEMTEKDHKELADVLHSLSGFVVLSGYECDLYNSLYGDWKSVEKETYADGARGRTEKLWLSPRTVEALNGGSMTGGLFDWSGK